MRAQAFGRLSSRPSLSTQLCCPPREQATGSKAPPAPVQITLPLPDGTFARFEVEESCEQQRERRR
jgi:hypothetical protein